MPLNYRKRKITPQGKLIDKWNRYVNHTGHPELMLLNKDGTCAGLTYVFASYHQKGEERKFAELLKKASRAHITPPDEETKQFIKEVAEAQKAQAFIPKVGKLNQLRSVDKHLIIATTIDDVHELISPLKVGEYTAVSFLRHAIYVAREKDGGLTVYDSNQNKIKTFEDDYSASRYLLKTIRNTKKDSFFETLLDIITSIFAPHIKQDYLGTSVVLGIDKLSLEQEAPKVAKQFSFDPNNAPANRALLMQALYDKYDIEQIKELFQELFKEFDYKQYDLNTAWEMQQNSGKFEKKTTLFAAALTNENFKAAGFFLEQGARIENLFTALVKLHNNKPEKQVEMLDSMLKELPDLLTRDDKGNGQGNKILDYAIHNKSIPMIEALLDRGADPTPLLLKLAKTQEGEDLSKLNQILQKKPGLLNKCNSKIDSILPVAAHCDNIPFIKTLLEQGADPSSLITYLVDPSNDKGQSQLTRLIQEIPDFSNYRGKDGLTMLHKAILFNNPVLIDLLLRNGAQLDAKIEKTENQKELFRRYVGNTALELVTNLSNVSPEYHVARDVITQRVVDTSQDEKLKNSHLMNKLGLFSSVKKENQEEEIHHRSSLPQGQPSFR